MLTDARAIGLSLLALRLAARPARGNLTFGLKRTEILSAQVNGGTLLVLAGLIVYEAIHRLVTPPAVQGWTVLSVALAGVAVNLPATWQLAKGTGRTWRWRAASNTSSPISMRSSAPRSRGS